MKKRTIALLTTLALATGMVAGCGSSNTAATDTAKTSETVSSEKTEATETVESTEVDDQAAADHVAELIDAIYVQTRNDDTDAQCAEAKEAWDALTDAQKELVSGENADPDYFGRDTGDASKDDPLNEDGIGENELLVVSFGTSFNDSRAEDIGGVEKALQAAYPDWSVRRAFTAQIIINHVQARDDEKIDNVDQALERAVDNGVKNLVVQPTHLMHGAEYDELVETLDNYKDKFETVTVAEPMLGEVGSDATVINEDKAKVAEAITAEAVKTAGYDSLDAAKEDGTAFVFMGHTQISGLGRIEAIQQIYIDHTKDAIDSLGDLESTSTTESTVGTLEDGVYTAKFDTDSSMFHVNEADEGRGILTVENGKMTIHISLVSKKIVNLFVGTADDAKKDGADILEPTTDTVKYSDGTTDEVYGFDVPVEALDEEFDLAILGTKGEWYDHKVSVSDPQETDN